MVSSLIEARGAERLQLVEEALEDEKLKQFYARLARAEAHHNTFFLEMASFYFSKLTIDERMETLLDLEAEAISSVPYRSALH